MGCCGNVVIMAEVPVEECGKGLAISIVGAREAIAASGSSVHLVLHDNDGRALSTYEARLKQAEDISTARACWVTGDLGGDVYRIEVMLRAPDGKLMDSCVVERRLHYGSVSEPILAIAAVQSREGFRLSWVGVCVRRSGDDVLTLGSGDPPQMTNVSCRELRTCKDPLGNRWEVEYLVDGVWGGHGLKRAFTLPDSFSRLEPGEEVSLLEQYPRIVRKGRPIAPGVPKRIAVRVGPPAEAYGCLGEPAESQRRCCDIYYVRWPTDVGGLP
jgi:hypothetical protein